MMSGVVAALIVMVLWGVADFLQSIPSKKLGAAKTMFLTQAAGLMMTLIITSFLRLNLTIALPILALLLVGGCIDVLASYNFFRSLEIGEVAIVAPISASYSLVTVVLAALLLGERLSLIRYLGIAGVVLGIMLASTDLRKLHNMHLIKGIRESIIALLGWGVYFFVIGLASASIGGMELFLLTGLINGALMSAYALSKGGRPQKEDFKGSLIAQVMTSAILYTAAWAILTNASKMEKISLLAPVSSLYPAVTIMLAVIFFKDKLVPNQIAGISLILLSLFLIS